MEREEVVVALREDAVDVLSVDPDAVVEDARFKEDLENVATVGQAVDLVIGKVDAK